MACSASDKCLSRVLQAGGYAVDGEQQQVAQPLLLRLVVDPGPQRPERAKLQMRQRVDVRVAKVDGRVEHPASFEQPRLAEDREDRRARQVELGQDAVRELGTAAELQVAGG